MISQTDRKLTYPISLLLSTANRKTFESLGFVRGISGDTIARIVECNAATVEDLLKVIGQVFKNKRLYLIIDDTLILKRFSKFIPGTSDNYDSADRKTYRSLCSVVAMITDGHTAIPIDQAIWTALEFATETYKKKWEIAQLLVEKIRKEISLYMVLADGLYAVREFIGWLIDQNIRFEMRFHANRVINDDQFKGQIKHHKKLRLSGKRPMRTIRAEWYGMKLHFTAFRRVTKYGRVITTYQVSNHKCSAREHVQSYEYRWHIEKFFRTAKQHLGLNDCQSRKIDLHEKHILNVFFTYALLQYERMKNRLKNVESAIKSTKALSFNEIQSKFKRSVEIFGVA
jgi:hypothetical protein